MPRRRVPAHFDSTCAPPWACCSTTPARNALVTCLRTLRIRLWILFVVEEPVLGPLVDIPFHVIETPRIRLLLLYGMTLFISVVLIPGHFIENPGIGSFRSCAC